MLLKERVMESIPLYVDMEKLTYSDGQPEAFLNSGEMAMIRALNVKEAFGISVETFIESIIKAALERPEEYATYEP